MNARLILLTATLLGTAWAERRVAVVVDTSGSMSQSDRPRYTVQIAKILGDLIADQDRLTVVRLPDDPSRRALNCADPADGRLSLPLAPSSRPAFKEQVDRFIPGYDGGNDFPAPVRTAIEALSMSPGVPRLLLFLADSGGLMGCERQLTAELLRLRQSGAVIAAVNLGGTTGAFGTNPAFEFTTAAGDAEEMVRSVADIYQRFLGARSVQTGRVDGRVEVRIDPMVKEAFLVVASDGPIAGIEEAAGNPGARQMELDFRGGGQTAGLDGVTRSYKMVRLAEPAPGRWVFNARGVSAGGWMLLMDYAVSLRIVSSSKVPAGVPNSVEVEVVDGRTGKRITDPAILGGLRVEGGLEGAKVQFTPAAGKGDGVLSANIEFKRPGLINMPFRVSGGNLDRTVEVPIEVVDAAWRVVPQVAGRVEVGRPSVLRAKVEAISSGVPAAPVGQIEVRLDNGDRVMLKPAGNGMFEGTWVPSRTGPTQGVLVPTGGGKAVAADFRVEVDGRLRLDRTRAIRFAALRSKSEGAALLDLATAEVAGDITAEATTDLDQRATTLEIETPQGWQRLGTKPVALRIEEHGQRSWRLRLRTGECPAACAPLDPHRLTVTATTAGGPQSHSIPLSAEIFPDPWYVCWWKEIVALLGIMVAAIVAGGYFYPNRFAPRAGVQLSPEEDLSEGFFFHIRSQRGSGIGFYRHARVYVSENFQVSGKRRGALMRLRAGRSEILLRPENGSAVLRQSFDGEWEPVPAKESTLRPGTTYRNEAKTFFLELRTK